MQKEGETAAQYLQELRSLSHPLDFEGKEDALGFLQFSNGLLLPEIQTQLVANPNFTLQQALDLATSLENSRSSVNILRNGVQNMEIHRVEDVSRPRRQQYKPTSKQNHKQFFKNKQSFSPTVLCFRCGSIEHKANKCGHAPLALRCATCKETGHVAKVCGIRRQRRQRIHHVGSDDEDESSHSSDCFSDSDMSSVSSVHSKQPSKHKGKNQPTPSTATHSDLFNLHTVEQKDVRSVKPFYKILNINGKPLTFELDTRAGRTVITDNIFKKCFQHSVTLSPTSTCLAPWGGSLPLRPLGEFDAKVEWNGGVMCLPLLVLKGRGPNLLGRDWLVQFYGPQLFVTVFDLNQVKVYQAPQDKKLDSVVSDFLCSIRKAILSQKKLPDLANLVAPLPAVSGIGTGPFKGVPVHLETLPDAQPKYQRARPVAFSLAAKYEEAIRRRVDAGRWIPVDPVEQPIWASATVPVVKRSGEVRICADYKATVNPAIPEDVFAPPTLDEVFASLAGASFCGEIDLEDAYTQVPVDLATSRLLTVTTVQGLFRPTTLQFGIKFAPAIFQRIVNTLFAGLPGVIAYQDNIYVSGSTVKEYVQRLATVLIILGNSGLKVNASKCNWGSTSISVLGFRVDAQGVHPTEDKIKAILEAPAPSDKRQLQSMLGLVAFYERFIPNKAFILEPLYRLLDKHASWKWTPACDQAFCEIKAKFSKRQVLTHYSLRLPVVISCDASESEVGAVIAHLVSSDSGLEERPIAFASRTLTKSERNYSQLDKEAQGIIFSVKKFYRYLFARPLIVYTDHRPLLGILDAHQPVKEHLSPRMLRWSLFLSRFQYRLIYKPGPQIAHADFLSRHPLPLMDEDDKFPEPAGIWLLAETITPVVTAEEVAPATAEDVLLSKVFKFTLKGWPLDTSSDFSLYKAKRDELSILKGCLLWGDRVVIPSALRPRILQLLHASHYGMPTTKALARSLVWWPGIDKAIEEEVKLCGPCQLTANKPADIPKSWPMPSGPWERVHMDIAGPFIGHYFLLMIDAFSKWPAIKILADITANSVIRALRYIFADFDGPRMLVSDNGPQFTAEKVQIFLQRNNVRHYFTPPWHPSSNILAERSVQTMKKLLRHHSGDVHERLARTLYAMRTHISSVTGESPSALMGRPFRHWVTAAKPVQVTHDRLLPAPFPKGSTVWVLKHKLNTKPVWLEGAVLAVHGPRVLDIQLQDGSVLLNISATHVRARADAAAPQEQEPKENGKPAVRQAAAVIPSFPVPIQQAMSDQHIQSSSSSSETQVGSSSTSSRTNSSRVFRRRFNERNNFRMPSPSVVGSSSCSSPSSSSSSSPFSGFTPPTSSNSSGSNSPFFGFTPPSSPSLSPSPSPWQQPQVQTSRFGRPIKPPSRFNW